MHLRTPRSTAVPLLLAAALALSACGGGGDDDDPDRGAIERLPKVKQNGVVDAKDVADANAQCALFQKKKPKLVTQIRFKVPGSPSVSCIVQ